MWLIHCIIGGVACPAGREAEDGRGEAQNAARFGGADFHGEVDKGARMRELAQDDEEDDEGGDPTIEFVVVDDLVAEEGDEEGACGNDDDARVPRDIIVDSV